MNLPYTIAKENLKALGLYVKGMAIGVAEFGMKVTNTILGTKIWKEFNANDKNEYQAQAAVSGYNMGFALPIILLVMAVIGYMSVTGLKLYTVFLVSAFTMVYLIEIVYPLTRDLINFYNREVHHES